MRSPRTLLTLVAGFVLALLSLPIGTAHAAASMTVWDFNGTTIAPGGTFAMGTTTVGVPFQHYFVVAPSSPDPLENVSVSVPAGFQVIFAPPATIQPGAAHGTTVRCLAQAEGVYSGQVVITSNAVNSPYTFTISCTVDPQPNTPDIALTDFDNAPIPPGGSLALGATDPNVTKAAAVRVFNHGTGPLVLEPVQYSDATFTTTAYVPDTVGGAGGYHVYFNVRCKSATPGLHSATATVPSNDPDTPNYSFTVTCTVNGAVDPPQDPVDPPDEPVDPQDDPVDPQEPPADGGGGDTQAGGGGDMQAGGGGDTQAGDADTTRGDAPEPSLPHTGIEPVIAMVAGGFVLVGLAARRAARRVA